MVSRAGGEAIGDGSPQRLGWLLRCGRSQPRNAQNDGAINPAAELMVPRAARAASRGAEGGGHGCAVRESYSSPPLLKKLLGLRWWDWSGVPNTK